MCQCTDTPKRCHEVSQNMKNVNSTPRKTAADRPTQLHTGERLFLWGFRAIAQQHHCEHPVVAAIQQCYGEFGVSGAAALIEALVNAFFHTAHTTIAIHNPRCPCVSDEEAYLLRAMALTQFGYSNAAGRQFERWLPKLAAEWVLAPVSEVGKLFHAAGLSFCLGDVDRLNLAEGGHQSWPTASRALH